MKTFSVRRHREKFIYLQIARERERVSSLCESMFSLLQLRLILEVFQQPGDITTDVSYRNSSSSSCIMPYPSSNRCKLYLNIWPLTHTPTHIIKAIDLGFFSSQNKVKNIITLMHQFCIQEDIYSLNFIKMNSLRLLET